MIQQALSETETKQVEKTPSELLIDEYKELSNTVFSFCLRISGVESGDSDIAIKSKLEWAMNMVFSHIRKLAKNKESVIRDVVKKVEESYAASISEIRNEAESNPDTPEG